jgi:hypothetical protein
MSSQLSPFFKTIQMFRVMGAACVPDALNRRERLNGPLLAGFRKALRALGRQDDSKVGRLVGTDLYA